MKDKFNLTGTKILDFELPNTSNEKVSIADLQGEKNVVVVLLRSKY